MKNKIAERLIDAYLGEDDNSYDYPLEYPKGKNTPYVVYFPTTPGGNPRIAQGFFSTLKAARNYAKKRLVRRPDLKYIDARIEKDDKFVEYCGPFRSL